MLDREKTIRELKAARLFFEMGSNRAGGVVGNLGCKSGMKYIEDALDLLKEQPQIIRCKDCKHRPKTPNWETYENGFDIEFPEDSKCPCQCSGDGYYSWYPEDNWYCADGERR